jgi:hypothetical protein
LLTYYTYVFIDYNVEMFWKSLFVGAVLAACVDGMDRVGRYGVNISIWFWGRVSATFGVVIYACAGRRGMFAEEY